MRASKEANELGIILGTIQDRVNAYSDTYSTTKDDRIQLVLEQFRNHKINSYPEMIMDASIIAERAITKEIPF